jgi:hypothetical protein
MDVLVGEDRWALDGGHGHYEGVLTSTCEREAAFLFFFLVFRLVFRSLIVSRTPVFLLFYFYFLISIHILVYRYSILTSYG